MACDLRCDSWFWIPGPLVSIFEISSKNDAEWWGRELWGISLGRVPDPFDFYALPSILVLPCQTPPGPSPGQREQLPSPETLPLGHRLGGWGWGGRSFSTCGGQRHLRKNSLEFCSSDEDIVVVLAPGQNTTRWLSQLQIRHESSPPFNVTSRWQR